MARVIGLVCLLFTLVFSAAPGQEKKPEKPEAFTDPAKAGPDFAVQGEYVGDSFCGKFGLQVMAEGDGRFAVRLLKGGLPGDERNGDKHWNYAASTAVGKITFPYDDGRGEYRDRKWVMTNKISGAQVEFKKVERTSPTLGMKPLADAIVLFDGKNADAWDKGKVENGTLSVLVPDGCVSKQKFGDCTLHVEFRTPFMPKARGQERGNSGVYVQGRYEVQVLDSFGLAGKNNECGGIYGATDPKVNMCFPPLAWQTYDIDFTAARYENGTKTADAVMTLKHNGVLIHDKVTIKNATPGGPLGDGPGPGPLFLQNHGDPVVYRNIWVMEKK